MLYEENTALLGKINEKQLSWLFDEIILISQAHVRRSLLGCSFDLHH